jgi:hypothetical protein
MAAALLIGGSTNAQSEASRRKDLVHLMERAVTAGHSLVEAAERDGAVSAADKRDLKGQFSLLLIRAGTHYDRCPTVFFSAVALAATVIFWLCRTNPDPKKTAI